MALEEPEDPDRLIRDVGRRIQEVRRAAGLTQEEVAERLDVTVRALAYVEAGRRNVTLRSLAHIAAVLGVRTIELLAPPASREVKQGRPRKRKT